MTFRDCQWPAQRWGEGHGLFEPIDRGIMASEPIVSEQHVMGTEQDDLEGNLLDMMTNA